MSIVKVLPSKWQVSEDESLLQIYGRLPNTKTFYAETSLQNYLSVLYISDRELGDLDTEHLFYQGRYPIYSIKRESERLYRFYVSNKRDREIVTELIDSKRFMKLINRDQSLLSKFFIENSISPGNSQFLYNPEVTFLEGYDMTYKFNGISSYFSVEIPIAKRVFLSVDRQGRDDKLVSISLDSYITSVGEEREVVRQAEEHLASLSPDYLIYFGELPLINLPKRTCRVDISSYIQKEHPEIDATSVSLEAVLSKYSVKSLSEFWSNGVEQNIRALANFWKLDITSVLSLSTKELMRNLIYSFTAVPPPVASPPAFPSPDVVPLLKGLYSSVYVYSMSNIYLSHIIITDSLSGGMKKYFENTKRGRALYESGYVMTLALKLPNDTVWFDRERIWLLTNNEYDYTKIDTGRVTIATKNYFYYETSGSSKHDIGDRSLLQQPFRLINKYINHIIQFLKEHPGEPIVFPNFDQQLFLGDLEMKIRIYPEYGFTGLSDSVGASPFLKTIIDQMRDSGDFKPKGGPEEIKYIMTVDGPLIESIYMKDLARYSQRIDFGYYNTVVKSTLAEFD